MQWNLVESKTGHSRARKNIQEKNLIGQKTWKTRLDIATITGQSGAMFAHSTSCVLSFALIMRLLLSTCCASSIARLLRCGSRLVLQYLLWHTCVTAATIRVVAECTHPSFFSCFSSGGWGWRAEVGLVCCMPSLSTLSPKPRGDTSTHKH